MFVGPSIIGTPNRETVNGCGRDGDGRRQTRTKTGGID
jgi:hypothetical protein